MTPPRGKQKTASFLLTMGLLSTVLSGSCSQGGRQTRGTLDQQQKDEAIRMRFQALDTNGDQYLSASEFAKSGLSQQSRNPERAFNFADANGDSRVSRQEFAVAFEKLNKLKSKRR